MKVQIAMPQVEMWRIDSRFANLPHVHEEQFQLTVPIYGTCFFHHEQQEYRLTSGEGLLLYPNSGHSFELSTDASVIIFIVSQTSLSELYRDEPSDFACKQQIDPREVNAAFRDWNTALFLPEHSDDQAIQETEWQILAYLQRSLQTQSPSSALSSPERIASGYDPHTARVLEYIHDRYTTSVSLDDLAAIAHQSRYHFIRSFKAKTGLTPYQYTLKLRIDEAKNLLRQPGRSVTDISFTLGFSSTSQFYRVFRKWVGCTPEQYRR